MKKLQIEHSKVNVDFFQRKPRKGFSFSLESIFADVRKNLNNKINSIIYISTNYNDGWLTKFYNIIEAYLRQNNKHITHITGELHFLNLLMRRRRVVLTVLDCGMMNRKTGFSKYIVKWLYLIAPVKKAALVTAISEVTKNEIIQYTGCKPNKIKVIPVAVNPMYQPTFKIFNSITPTILHIGTGYNKNLKNLINALSGIDCLLIIVGKLSEDHLQLLKENCIIYRNDYNITDEQMLNNYINCDILSFISTFEGFGMPIIEANSIERVVITSNISSMPEVAGNAACLVNPYDIEEIKNGVLNIINNESLRHQLIENGRINKLRFQPNSIADMYYNAYVELITKI
jgi:glycosyltransferase involved in cell wall biosynthesis